MIAPVRTSTLAVCCRNRSDPSSLYRTYGALQVLQKKRSRFGLAWSRPCADLGLSPPISVFHTTIGVYKILSGSDEIWQHEGQKILLLSKNRARQSLWLALQQRQNEMRTNL